VLGKSSKSNKDNKQKGREKMQKRVLKEMWEKAKQEKELKKREEKERREKQEDEQREKLREWVSPHTLDMHGWDEILKGDENALNCCSHSHHDIAFSLGTLTNPSLFVLMPREDLYIKEQWHKQWGEENMIEKAATTWTKHEPAFNHLIVCLAYHENWWRIILFLFKIIEYGVSWLRKLSEIPTGH